MASQTSIPALLSPWTLGRDLWVNRVLIAKFTQREIQGRYRGTLLGLVWSFVTPLAMLAVYTLVFGGIFGARWPGLTHDGVKGLMAFAVAMFAGSTTFGLFSEPVGRAAGAIVSVPNYVKKVIFPLQILPVVMLGTALFHALIAFSLVMVGAMLVLGHLSWTALLLPVVVIPTVLASMGVAWFLAALGVYMRDAGQAVGVALQILFFATPIFYSVDNIPARLRWLVYLNPLTYGINIVRDVLVMGRLPAVHETVIAFAAGLILAQLGYAWFMLTRRGFADVL